MDSREFENKYGEYTGEQLLDESTGKLCEPYHSEIVSCIHRLFTSFASGAAVSVSSGNSSVYTGTSGIAIAYLRLYEVLGDKTHLDSSVRYADEALHKSGSKSKRSQSFMAGDSGPLAVGAAVYSKLAGSEHKARGLAERYVSLCEEVCRHSKEDEVLYGRSGYLLGLLYLRRCGSDVGEGCEQRVVDAIIRSGVEMSDSLRPQSPRLPPLMYEWHDKVYLGAAHGISGIIYTLLKCHRLIPSQVMREKLMPTIDYLLSLQFPSGNFPSSLGNESDRLIHWCHGAPGFVHMLSSAYRVLGDERYLSAALKCGEVVWRRGLLRKGYGICHGVAGNGYVFLSLYQATHEPAHLYRAVKFAQWCCQYGQHGCRQADRPYSLYEGMAGTIYFLTDILQPDKAALPAFGF